VSRWQRLISRFFPQEAELIAEVDATEEGDALAVRLAIPIKDQQGEAPMVPVTAIDIDRGRVRTPEGDFRVKDEGRRILAAITPEGHATLRRQSRAPDGAVHVDEAHLPDALRDLRAVADQGHIVESSNARAIKLSDRRPLQYEFQVDFADEESLAVTPQIVSADGKVRLDPAALQPPPSPESHRRGRRDVPAESSDLPRWVRQGKTYYPTPAAPPEEIAPFSRQHVVLRGDDVPFFLARQLKQLGRNGRVIASDAVKEARVAANPLEPVSVLDLDDEGWLSVDVTYRGEPEAGRSGAGPVPGVTFTREEIDALPEGARYIRHGNTWIPIDRKAEKKLHEALSQVERKLGAQRDDQGRLRVAPGKGDETRRMLLNVAEIDEGVAFQKFLADLAGFRQIEPLDPPQGLTATLRPYQVEGFRWLAFLRKYYLNGVLADDMGLGKALALDAKILTPTGWKRMGDIQVGDAVINSQGGTSHVTGVYPQGEKDLYKVEFTDGSSVECCDEHLWYVNTPLRRDRGYGGKVLPLAEIRNSLKDSSGNNRHFIPMVKPIEFEDRELPLDPYLVGVLLGDGGLSTGRTFLISADQELLDYAKDVLPVGAEIVSAGGYDWRIASTNRKSTDRRNMVNPVTHALRDLGLMGHTAHTKFIPDLYKFASVQSRLELLRGLMDTDGSISNNVLEFSSVSEQLCHDVQFLIQSLGGIARMKQKRTTWTYLGVQKTSKAYRLTIAMPGDINPFRLKRKADLWLPRAKYPPVRAFKSVTYIGKKPAQCIAVDSPDHLYVTDECIVTHNTIQLLSLLQYAKEHPDAETPDPSLIICPTSCVDNWIDEASKFTPELRIRRYIGNDRATAFADAPDVLVTTYETLRRDMGRLLRQPWDYVILDEAQKIKNPITETARACRHLLARHRLAVTGTPIENKLDELWAQFDFLMPGYLGSQARFRRDYEGPIMREKDNSVAEDLKRKIAPFILRRMKEQVAQDLPPKIYVSRECALTREQSKLYERIAGEGRQRVMEQARSGSETSLTMSILASLTHLKQICCHPALLEGDPATCEIHKRSGKFEDFKEVLDERLDAGDKVLVFSQYADMCKIIDRYLHESGIPSLYLDGQTRNRQELVRTFQTDPSIKVFVLSLRAAGFGITLTAASSVIHYDRWWNPAVENQATDRAYRIGQKRSVQVIQFQTADTIEEKIDKMLASKTELFGDVIETDLGGKSISREELLDLFSYSPLGESATEEGIPVITDDMPASMAYAG
jgi:hypothetical protein